MQRTPTVKRRNVGETTPPPRLDEEDCSVSQRHTKMSAAVLFRRDRALHHHFCSLSFRLGRPPPRCAKQRAPTVHTTYFVNAKIYVHIIPHVYHWRAQTLLVVLIANRRLSRVKLTLTKRIAKATTTTTTRRSFSQSGITGNENNDTDIGKVLRKNHLFSFYSFWPASQETLADAAD